MRQVNPKLEIACGDYDYWKSQARFAHQPHRITMKIVEKRNGLKPGQLKSYRANYLSRKNRT